MNVEVRIPTLLRKFTKGKATVKVEGKTIEELLKELNKKYPGIRERICDEKGEIRRFINIYVNDEDIRFLKGKKTKLEDGNEVSILPAVAGGGSTRLPMQPRSPFISRRKAR